jgi:hypothetical protein
MAGDRSDDNVGCNIDAIGCGALRALYGTDATVPSSRNWRLRARRRPRACAQRGLRAGASVASLLPRTQRAAPCWHCARNVHATAVIPAGTALGCRERYRPPAPFQRRPSCSPAHAKRPAARADGRNVASVLASGKTRTGRSVAIGAVADRVPGLAAGASLPSSTAIREYAVDVCATVS